MLLPLVSSVDELREAKAALRSATCRMSGPGQDAAPMPVGIMIEVPSAALTVDLLAAEADFFSIGTNDLIQYCLAVDRTDGRVAGLFDPLHPAILRVIRNVIRLARPRGRQVAVCGEMAADPGALLLLLGLGVTEFSMSPAAIPEARALVRQVSMRDARRTAARAIGLPTSHDIAALLAARFPELAHVAGRPRRPAAHGGAIVSAEIRPGVFRVDKPWGYELLWAKTDRYVGKIIHVNAGHALSLQYHNVKTETVYLASGTVRYEIQDGDGLRSLDLSPGDRSAHPGRDRPPRHGDRRRRHLRSVDPRDRRRGAGWRTGMEGRGRDGEVVSSQ